MRIPCPLGGEFFSRLNTLIIFEIFKFCLISFLFGGTSANLPVSTQFCSPESTFPLFSLIFEFQFILSYILQKMKKLTLILLFLTFSATVLSQTEGFDPRANQDPGKCSAELNLYWTGYRCACRVGYFQKSGTCTQLEIPAKDQAFRPAQFIYKISKLYSIIECNLPNEELQQLQCVCREGFFRNLTGQCQVIQECPVNSIFTNGNCQCITGFRFEGERCVKICPPNSNDNGFGECVCVAEYYRDEYGSCRPGSSCPPFSKKNNAGVCVCNDGYIEYIFEDSQMACIRCPEGEYWDATLATCVFVCSLNEEYSNTLKKCVCKDGYGIYNKKCSLCPSGFFIHEGSCVSCPVSTVLVGNDCVCKEGFKKNMIGLCEPICSGPYEQFDSSSGKCVCMSGYAYNNNNVCVKRSCSENEIQVSGKCICKVGYGRNTNNSCVNCQILQNAFLIDGYCVTCPPGFIAANNQCECPAGKIPINGVCAQQCKSGQLADPNGHCYYCPINEAPKNGKCECLDGHERNGGRCEPSCPSGRYLINGRCGKCALNTIYNEEFGLCLCPDGQYLNNLGYCENTQLIPSKCEEGKYKNQDQICVNCPIGCATCELNKCLTCTNKAYTPYGFQCLPLCGNSVVTRPDEECDDGNQGSGDGCSNSCKVEQGWRCVGQPSVCEKIVIGSFCGNGKVESGEQCDDSNTKDGDGCSASCKKEAERPNEGMKLINSLSNENNVFIMIRTDSAFKFANEQEARNFLKYEFPDAGTTPNSAYCMQEFNPTLFRCLFLYASGLPNYPFKMLLTYDRDGKSGYLKVEVDPLQSTIMSRSLH